MNAPATPPSEDPGRAFKDADGNSFNCVVYPVFQAACSSLLHVLYGLEWPHMTDYIPFTGMLRLQKETRGDAWLAVAEIAKQFGLTRIDEPKGG
jgi:hypothetical protein